MTKIYKPVISIIIQLKTGCDGSRREAKGNSLSVSGDNKLATSRNNRFLAVLLYFNN